MTCLKCRAVIPPEQVEAPAEGGEGPTPYPVEPFKPTRGGAPAGVVVAIVVGLFGALVLGAVAALVRQGVWFVLVFPLLLGFGLGVCASAGAWLAKCRLAQLVAGAGAVVGLAGAFVLHYATYLIVFRDFPQPPVDFPEYLDLLCRAGVMSFGYTGSIIYYLVEVVVIAVAAGAGAVILLNGPFCEKCNLWKQKESLGTFKGSAQVAAWAVGTGRPTLMLAPTEADEKVTVEVYRCPLCRNDGPIDVKATCAVTENKNTATAVVFVTYPGAAAADFEKLRTGG